jgi:hypothetical protein
MAEPAGPMTFRCPLAVRSTCPPARCTAATISFASLERQRFGVACFFSAIPGDLQHPKDTTHGPHRGQRTLRSQAPRHRATPAERHVVQGAQPVDLRARSALGPCRNGRVGAAAVTGGHQRFRRTAGHRSSSSRSRDDARGRIRLWSRRPGVRVPSITLLNSGFALTSRLSSDAAWRVVNACERAALPGASSSRISSEPARPRHLLAQLIGHDGSVAFASVTETAASRHHDSKRSLNQRRSYLARTKKTCHLSGQ